MKSLHFTVPAILLCCISACKQQEIPKPEGSFFDMAAAMAEIAPKTQILTFDASTGGIVIGEGGTQLQFSPHSLVDAEGEFAEGPVTVRLIEILDVEDMISSGVYPLDISGDLLNSGGELYINITQGAKTLSIAPGSNYTIVVPSNGNDAPMDWYVGTGDSDTAFWEYISPTPLDSIGTISKDDPEYNIFYDAYTIITDVLGWLNCDALVAFGQVVCQFQVTGIEEPDPAPMALYYISDLIMTAVPVSGLWEAATQTIYDCYFYNSPGYILLTTVHDGAFHFGMTHVDPEEGSTYPIEVAPATLAEFEAALEAL